MNRDELVEAFRGLRVAHVCDGMDYVGCFERGNMSGKIRPLWRDTDTFAETVPVTI